MEEVAIPFHVDKRQLSLSRSRLMEEVVYHCVVIARTSKKNQNEINKIVINEKTVYRIQYMKPESNQLVLHSEYVKNMGNLTSNLTIKSALNRSWMAPGGMPGA